MVNNHGREGDWVGFSMIGLLIFLGSKPLINHEIITHSIENKIFYDRLAELKVAIKEKIMKKSMIMMLILLTSVSGAFAQSSRDRREMSKIKRLTVDVSGLMARGVRNLSSRDLVELRRALESTKSILEGNGPISGAMRPRRSRVCNNNRDIRVMENSEAMIRSAASSSLGMNWVEVDNFAAEWMSTYSCDQANRFSTAASELKEVVDNVLEMNWVKAQEFTRENAAKLCSGMNLRKTAKALVRVAKNRIRDWTKREPYVVGELNAKGFFNCPIPKAN